MSMTSENSAAELIVHQLHGLAKDGSGLANEIMSGGPDRTGKCIAMMLHALSGIILSGDANAIERAGQVLTEIAIDIFQETN